MRQTPSDSASSLFPVEAKLVIFDLDGTLVNAFEDIAAAVNYALGRQGRASLSKEEISRHVGHGARNLVRACLGKGAAEAEADQAFADWRDWYLEHPADFTALYPGALETLEALRQKDVRTAVVSNKLHELTCRVLEKVGLAPALDAIEGERLDQPRKPDPEAIRPLLRQFGAAPGQTLMVGDGDADMNVAKAAGVLAIGVSYGTSTPELLRDLGAAKVIDSLPQLLDLLK